MRWRAQLRTLILFLPLARLLARLYLLHHVPGAILVRRELQYPLQCPHGGLALPRAALECRQIHPRSHFCRIVLNDPLPKSRCFRKPMLLGFDQGEISGRKLVEPISPERRPVLLGSSLGLTLDLLKKSELGVQFVIATGSAWFFGSPQ